MTKMVLLGVVLWAGVSFGSHVAPYPLNLILTTGRYSINNHFNILIYVVTIVLTRDIPYRYHSPTTDV